MDTKASGFIPTNQFYNKSSVIRIKPAEWGAI